MLSPCRELFSVNTNKNRKVLIRHIDFSHEKVELKITFCNRFISFLIVFLTLFLWTFVVMNDSGKPQRVENLSKMSSNSTFRADDSEASAGLVRDKPRNGGPDSVRVDGGSKNGGQLNALVSSF